MKWLGRTLTTLRRFLVLAVLLVMLAFNVASFTVDSLNSAMSSIAKSIMGRSIVAEMRQQIFLQKKQITGLVSKSEGLRMRNGKLEADLDKKRSDLNKSQAELKATKTELKTANTELKTVNAKLINTKADLRKHRMVVDQSTERIARRVIRGAGRNVASVPLEVVPMVGVATVVAVTAMDIKEACDTLNDMQDLRLANGIDEEAKDWTSQVCGSFSQASTPEICGMTIEQCRDHAQAVRARIGGDLAASILEQCNELVKPDPEICRPEKNTPPTIQLPEP